MNHTRRERAAKAFAALLCLGLLYGCAPAATPFLPAATEAPLETRYPDIAPQAAQEEIAEHTASLYYRMRGESMLARETRTLRVPRDTLLEQALIEALIDGPSANLLDLTDVFIPGTKAEVSGNGSLLTVSLSRAFLNAPVDAPGDWRNDTVWRAEVLLRRRLALYAVVATITDETDYTAVQFLIKETEGGAGRRLSRSELYENARSDQLVGPLTRDEALLFSHFNAAAAILDCWQTKNFSRLYRFVAQSPTEAAFLDEMASYGRMLTKSALSPGTVSDDGQSAVLTVTLTCADARGEVTVESYPLHLVRENGLWKIHYQALKRMMEAT